MDLDEKAHYEPLHHNLHCLQILFSSLVLKELKMFGPGYIILRLQRLEGKQHRSL